MSLSVANTHALRILVSCLLYTDLHAAMHMKRFVLLQYKFIAYCIVGCCMLC